MPDHPHPSIALRIPRDAWPSHPHWDTQVLLLGSHDNFRRISRHLVDCAQRRESAVGIGSLFTRWISAMRSHEGYEEHKLYPFLTRRWRVSCAQAQLGHDALHAKGARVDAAVDAVAVDPAQWEALVDALREHDAVLHAHLDLEEELVVPLLLQLRPSEFHIYTMLSAAELLRRLETRGAIDAPA